jgi:hypothetical protein
MSTLERITHVVLIVVSITAGGLLLERRFAPPNQGVASAPGSPLIRKHLDVAGINWETHPVSAVLFMSTHCHFCLESMAYYRQLAAVRNTSGTHVPLRVVSMESSEDVGMLLSSEGVVADGVYKLPKQYPGLGLTPTLLVVNSEGIVRKVYLGKLGPTQEKEFLEFLKSGVI